jgi:hypothetical protein
MQNNLKGLARAFGAVFEALLDGLSEAVVVAFGCHWAGARFYRCGVSGKGRHGGEVADLHPRQRADERHGRIGETTLGVFGLVGFWTFMGKRGPIAMLHACENEGTAYLIPRDEVFRVAVFHCFCWPDLLD